MQIVEIESIEFTDLETEMVDLEVEDNHNFILANGILTHNSGKSNTIFSLGELVAKKNKTRIQTIGMDEVKLPTFIENIKEIEDVENNVVLTVGEGALTANARDSMSNTSKNIAKLLPIISHREVYILWASQMSYKTDKNLLYESDTIILLSPSLMQLEKGGERPTIKNIYDKYLPNLNKWINKLGTEKGVSIIYSKDFKGIVRWNLSSFFNDDMSKSYKNKQVFDTKKNVQVIISNIIPPTKVGDF